ncbi:DUF1385 domain-containing protein [Candidatus Bathyarchaeota archaeon CG_4_8_14_3_um_filter_42_8]|nr:MAG: DUF1385 domain-containing protein [Candidatus Bathyarchaeota archaeon CG_4_8_14_3_um_filter_42_8]
MKLATKGKEEPSLAFGGQAVIEGVMIRSKKHMVTCVRQPNDEILTNVEEIKSVSERHKVLRLPFLRGIVALFETLYIGVKGLYFSANASLEEEEKLNPKEIVLAVVVALALAIFLFSLLPFFLTTFLNFEGVVFNVAEGVIRLAILLLYLASITSIGEFKRVFQYHGAEHTAINAYEAGVELNVSNAKKFSRFHPRCGTSFIFIVALISILFFSIMPNLGFLMRLAYRILFIPVIGTVSYEVLKLSDRYKKSKIMKVLLAPGLGLQYLTTRKPDEKMIEVALEAVKKVNSLAETSQ